MHALLSPPRITGEGSDSGSTVTRLAKLMADQAETLADSKASVFRIRALDVGTIKSIEFALVGPQILCP